MQYPCATRPLAQLADPRAKTLCDTCKSKDCENPIEKRPVSIIGVNKMMRLYITRTGVSVVTQCDGFVG